MRNESPPGIPADAHRRSTVFENLDKLKGTRAHGWCKTLRDWTILDSELAAKLENLTAHLEGCVDCQQTFEFHAELRQIVRQAVHHEPLPESLVDRIKECFGTDLSNESDTQ